MKQTPTELWTSAPPLEDVDKEIEDLLNVMFPTPDQRTGGPDSTYARVRRLMCLASKSFLASFETAIKGYKDTLDRAIELTKKD